MGDAIYLVFWQEPRKPIINHQKLYKCKSYNIAEDWTKVISKKTHFLQFPLFRKINYLVFLVEHWFLLLNNSLGNSQGSEHWQTIRTLRRSQYKSERLSYLTVKSNLLMWWTAARRYCKVITRVASTTNSVTSSKGQSWHQYHLQQSHYTQKTVKKYTYT